MVEETEPGPFRQLGQVVPRKAWRRFESLETREGPSPRLGLGKKPPTHFMAILTRSQRPDANSGSGIQESENGISMGLWQEWQP